MVDDGAFIVGCEGILTEDETLHSLKVHVVGDYFELK